MLLNPLPLRQLQITDPFWSQWQRVNRDVTLPHQWQQLVETGRLENFSIAAGKVSGEIRGRYQFDDSDVYKWLEAAGYALLLGPDERLQRYIDEAIHLISEAQEADGYINTRMQVKNPGLKLRNLTFMHEMYCAGHLIEGAVALFECAGDRRLLDIAIKFADLLDNTFGPGKRLGYCGHEEIELALLRLAGATGDRKYHDLATWMVATRGTRPSPFEQELDDAESMTLSPYFKQMMFKDGKYVGEYAQDHAPVVEHTDVVGHAVRAMYLYNAATELGETAGQGTMEAMRRTWDNLTQRRMYVTGGVGPSGDNEGFTTDFDLPNLTSYAETCAACGLVFWGQKLLNATGSAEYAGVIERALYNGALSGISLSGDRYFYSNPLESRGEHARVPWFECACCPPNIARLIGSVGSYLISTTDSAFYIHIPAGIKAQTSFNGVATSVEIESNFPWTGKFVVHVNPASPTEFEVRVRIPDWCDEVDADVPGLAHESQFEDGYAVFKKVWKAGDTLTFDFGLTPQWVVSDPRVRDNLGRVALTYGPLIYCAEAIDNGFAPQTMSINVDEEVAVERSDMLGGIMKLTAAGSRTVEGTFDELYASADALDVKESSTTFVPYYAWNNRGAGEMQVWIRQE